MRQRDPVHRRDLAAHRNPGCRAADLHAERLESAGNIERGRFSLHRRIGGENDLADLLAVDQDLPFEGSQIKGTAIFDELQDGVASGNAGALRIANVAVL